MFGWFKKKKKEGKSTWTIWMKSQQCIECDAVAILHPSSPYKTTFTTGVCYKCGSTEIENRIVKYKREILWIYSRPFYIVEKYKIRGDENEYDITDSD